MLFTRCPECDTTFRVTDDTLKKASGQVRCGRCASVFNAYAELHDPSGKPLESSAAPRATESAPPAAPPAPAKPETAVAAASKSQSAAAAPKPQPTASLAPKPQPAAVPAPADAGPRETRPVEAAASIGPTAVADVAADTKVAGNGAAVVNDAGTPPETSAISATEVDRVLAVDAPVVPQSAYAWPRFGEDAPRRTQSRWWAVAAVLAVVALAAQTIHHFRSDIAGHATFGPWLMSAYEALGTKVTPSWDVHQYQIIDWVATAEPNARGLGSLKITARIQNRGPSRQPFPAVQLRLKDRYEAAVGSRMFKPAEYLPRDAAPGRLMSPGETTRAELEVVDPGPDAYGFELDVCIEVEASLVTCGTDEVFL